MLSQRYRPLPVLFQMYRTRRRQQQQWKTHFPQRYQGWQMMVLGRMMMIVVVAIFSQAMEPRMKVEMMKVVAARKQSAALRMEKRR